MDTSWNNGKDITFQERLYDISIQKMSADKMKMEYNGIKWSISSAHGIDACYKALCELDENGWLIGLDVFDITEVFKPSTDLIYMEWNNSRNNNELFIQELENRYKEWNHNPAVFLWGSGDYGLMDFQEIIETMERAYFCDKITWLYQLLFLDNSNGDQKVHALFSNR